MIITAPPNYVDGWIYDSSRNLYVQMTPTYVATAPVIIWHFQALRDNEDSPVYIDEVTVNLDGHGGGLSHASKPATLPRMEVGKVSSGATSSLGTAAVSSSITLASFNLGHDISVSLTHGQQASVDSYWIAVCGTAGEGSMPGALCIDNVTVVFDDSYGSLSW
jgi:hypothetical protein